MPKIDDTLTVDQVRRLPVDLTMTVPTEWEDRNGHVNVQHYLSIYHLGGWQVLDNIGIDKGYLAAHQVSIFDLEHHIKYLAEIHVGETVSVYSRMLNRNSKLLHGILFIVNDSHNRIACTIEYLSICIDQNKRRATTFPHDMTLRLDDLLAQHQTLNWQAPVCGHVKL